MQSIKDIWNDPTKSKVVVGVLGLGAGLGLGYILGLRAKRDLFEVPANQLEFDFDMVEIEEIKQGTARVNPMPIPVDVREISDDTKEEVKEFISEKLQEKMIRPSGNEAKAHGVLVEEKLELLPQPEPEELILTHNIFSEVEDNWDYEEELANRNPSAPYVIHRDEFFENDLGLAQVTLTYYAGDDIMADEEDQPIYNYKTVTGELKFGHGSGDPNVVYIRNAKRRTEYEILHDRGQYSVEVLGLDIEENDRVKDLKHSSGARKFRPE